MARKLDVKGPNEAMRAKVPQNDKWRHGPLNSDNWLQHAYENYWVDNGWKGK